MERLSCDALVIGGGVVGLAVAARLAATRAVVLVERHAFVGSETSSRNSEVVHAGIHYPKDSFKTRWCLQGKTKLYAYCREKGVPFRQTGKLVVATDDSERAYLDRLSAHSASVGVPHERWSQAIL